MNGYTGAAYERKLGAKEFLTLAARNFGFCVTLRDEDFDAPIPEEFTPGDYYRERKEQAEKALSEWSGLRESERVALVERKRAERIASLEESLQKSREQQGYFASLFNAVAAWQVPAELETMKASCLEWIEHDLRDYDNFYTERLTQLQAQTTESLLVEYATDLREEMERASEAYQQEVQRVAERNRYLKLFRESLAQFEVAR